MLLVLDGIWITCSYFLLAFGFLLLLLESRYRCLLSFPDGLWMVAVISYRLVDASYYLLMAFAWFLIFPDGSETRWDLTLGNKKSLHAVNLYQRKVTYVLGCGT